MGERITEMGKSIIKIINHQDNRIVDLTPRLSWELLKGGIMIFKDTITELKKELARNKKKLEKRKKELGIGSDEDYIEFLKQENRELRRQLSERNYQK